MNLIHLLKHCRRDGIKDIIDEENESKIDNYPIEEVTYGNRSDGDNGYMVEYYED